MLKHGCPAVPTTTPPVNSGRCVPLRHHVPGSPFQPRDIVRIVDAIDIDVHDVSGYIGRLGLVVHLDYSCGCGQRYPDDPSIGVKFPNGEIEEFWSEEVSGIKNGSETRR